MFGVVTVRVSAAHPDIPLREVPVISGSACTIAAEGVPSFLGTVMVTSVALSIQTPDGETSTVSARRCGQLWVATFGADRFGSVGTVRNGLTVTAYGVEEDGETPAEWTFGKGDVTVLDSNGVPAPGMTWQDVHLRDEVPDVPHKGDLARHDDGWKVYTGEEWSVLGESVTDYEQLENRPKIEGVELVGNKSAAQLGLVKTNDSRLSDSRTPKTHARTHWRGGSDVITPDAIGAYSTTGGQIAAANGMETSVKIGGDNDAARIHTPGVLTVYGAVDAATGQFVPAKIRKDGKDVATEDQLAVVMDLVESAGTYSVQLGGVAQTFEAVKELAERRNAVIRHGRGTYRVTYVGQSEMMWDCTGTVQGAVKTGTIHMFRENDVVQLVSARTVATADDVVPSGSGTEVIATICGKQIKAPAGGGGGGACIVTIVPLYTDESQVVSWALDGKSYSAGCVSGPYGLGALRVEVDGEIVSVQHETSRGSMTTVAGPRLSIDFDGYESDCAVYIDGRIVPHPLPATIDTDGHSHILIELAACLASDTLISMADGSLRRVCDIRDGDRVLSVDPETMQIVEDEVVGSDGGAVKIHDVTDVWTFDDGTMLRTVHPHEFFNVRTGSLEYIADFRIGDRVRRIDGSTPALVGHDVVYGDVMHNTLTTRSFGNYFAGGVLSGNRDSVRWGWMWQKRMGA